MEKQNDAEAKLIEKREKCRIAVANYREKNKNNPEYTERVKTLTRAYSKRCYEKDKAENEKSRWQRKKEENPEKCEKILKRYKEKYDKIRPVEKKKNGRKPKDYSQIPENELSTWGKLKLNNPEKYEENLRKRRERYAKSKMKSV